MPEVGLDATIKLPQKRITPIFSECAPHQLVIRSLKTLAFKDVCEIFPINRNLETKRWTYERLEEWLSAIFERIRHSIYVTSLEQFKKDVLTLIESVGSSLPDSIDIDGIEIINHKTSLQSDIYHGSKQGLFAIAGDYIRAKYHLKTVYSKNVLEFLLRSTYSCFSNWEMVEVDLPTIKTIIGLENTYKNDPLSSSSIKAKEHFDKVVEGPMSKWSQNLEELMFGYNDSFHRSAFAAEVLYNLDNDLILLILEDYVNLKDFISKVHNLPVFKNDFDKPWQSCYATILTVFQLGDKKSKSLHPEETSGMFVFCSEVKKYIELMISMKDESYMKKQITREDKFWSYIPYEEAISQIVEFTVRRIENVDCSLIEEPEIGFYSCPPIPSPNNMLCKPAIVVLRDFFNFLTYELNVFVAIKYGCRKDFRTYVDEFCDVFVNKKPGFYCISWDDFTRFLNKGRELFRDKLDENAERFQKMEGPNKSKPFVKPGILSFHDDDQVDIELGNKYYPLDQFTFQSFVKEFPMLCWMVHTQDACGFLGTCALKFHNIFENDTFCGEQHNKVQAVVTSTHDDDGTMVVPDKKDKNGVTLAQNEASSLKQENAELEKKIDDLTKTMENYEKEIGELRKQLTDSIEKSESRKQENIETIQKELEMLSMSDRDGKCEKQKLLEENEELKRSIVTLTNRETLTQRQNENLKFDRQKLTSDNQNLSRKLAVTSSNVSAQNEEITKLRRQLADCMKESEGWKKNYEKVIRNDQMEESLKLFELGINNPVAYYTKFIEQGNNLVQTARDDLRKFLQKSKIRNDRVRAERELMDFEMTADCLIRKARANLNILNTGQHCDRESLMKVEPYPMPFSSFIYSRMDS